jgi:hypothetical protein
MPVEPGHSPAQEADRCGLLLFRENQQVGQSGGIFNRNLHTVVAVTGRAVLLQVTGRAVADLVKAGELYDIDMDQVSGVVSLVAMHWRFGLEIPQPPETKAIVHHSYGGERAASRLAMCRRWRR